MKPFRSFFVNIVSAGCHSGSMLVFVDTTLIEHGHRRGGTPKNCSFPACSTKMVHPERLPVDLSLLYMWVIAYCGLIT